MNLPTPELLAPAGEPDAAFAALAEGADAVYLGLKRFSARADASNFTPDQLGEVVAFAHGLPRPRRVYVTLNTLVQEREWPSLVDAVATAAEIGVDAVIVQDLGVARLVRQHLRHLRLHASTQLSIHSLAGAVVLRDLGFSRVTLARELTLDEIGAIVRSSGIEVETFAHGALCYCYSGLCLYSSHLRGRSGNRGCCGYPCRDAFRSPDGRAGHVFSMKDLVLRDRVLDLRRAGVRCLKIEGRKKSPLYVASVTRLYRGVLDGSMDDRAATAQVADVQTVFSRSTTALYLSPGHGSPVVDIESVGHRGVPIGVVDEVTRSRRSAPGSEAEHWLRFTTSREIERHDGIQVDLPGVARPFGFAVDELRTGAGRAGPDRANVHLAKAGSRVSIRLPDDAPPIPVGAPVYCASSQAVKRGYAIHRPRPGVWASRRRLDVQVTLTESAVLWTASTVLRMPDNPRVDVSGSQAGTLSPARNPEGVEASIRAAFSRLGNTTLEVDNLSIVNPLTLFAPASVLNAARRAMSSQVTAAIEHSRAASVRLLCDPVELGTGSNEGAAPDRPIDTQHAEQEWFIKTDHPECLRGLQTDDWAALDGVTVELTTGTAEPAQAALANLSPMVGRDRIRLALPTITRAWEESALMTLLRSLVEDGWSRWEVANLSGWNYLKEAGAATAPGFDLTVDWPLYALNRMAVSQLLEMGARSVTLSPEDDLRNWRDIPDEARRHAVVIVFQDTPLFVSETCSAAALAGGCERCTARRGRRVDELTSSTGERVLAVTRACRTTVVNQAPFCIAHLLEDLRSAGLTRCRVDFMTRPYTPEQAAHIWRTVRAGRAPVASHAANVLRGLDSARSR